MRGRTDLAAEQAGRLGERLPRGIKVEEEQWGLVTVLRVRVTDQPAAELLGKPVGSYYTIEGRSLEQGVDDNPDRTAAAARVLKGLLPQQGTVLVVGLGNREMTPDALGPMVADRVLATRHLEENLRAASRLRETAVLAPGVLPQTGLEVAEQVGWAVREMKPAAVVVVDALAAAEPGRLGRTIQIADSGITPGSGVMGNHLPLDRERLGVPVISVGIPMVIDAETFVDDYLRQVGVEEEVIESRKNRPMLVAPHDADLVVRRGAGCIALALNMALQPGLSEAEIRVLSE